jgi:SAM-dependent methyltransferase
MVFDEEADGGLRGADNVRAGAVADWVRTKSRPLTVLDVGCWAGELGRVLAPDTGITYVGADIEAAEQATRVARRRVPGGSFVTFGSVSDLPFRTESFDAVVFTEVIEHLPRGEEVNALREISRVLRPDGSVGLSTPALNGLAPVDPAWYFGHRHYSVKQLDSLAASAGLRLTSIGYFGGLWQGLDINLLYIYKHILRRPYPGWPVITAQAGRQAQIHGHRRSATNVWCELAKRTT